MRFNVSAERFAGNLGDLFRSTLGAGALEAQARRKEESRLAQAFRNVQSGRKSAADASLLEDQFQIRQGLAGAVAPLFSDLGLSSEAAGPGFESLVRSASPSSNAAQLGQLFETLINQGRRTSAVNLAPTDPSQANVLLSAGDADPVLPFRQNAAGLVLNTGTGAQDTSTPLAQTFLDNERAQTAQRNAAAENSLASAGRTDTRLLPELNLLEAQTNAANARVASAGAGGVKPSASNAIRSAVTNAFGGIFDPITGTVSGIDKETAIRALDVSARAEQLMQTSGLPVLQAVQTAMSEARSAGTTTATPSDFSERVRQFFQARGRAQTRFGDRGVQ